MAIFVSEEYNAAKNLWRYITQGFTLFNQNMPYPSGDTTIVY